MKFLYIFVSVTFTVTTVTPQDPPPVFDLPLPPPIDFPVNDEIVISNGDTVISSKVTDDNGTFTVETSLSDGTDIVPREISNTSLSETESKMSRNDSEKTVANQTLAGNASVTTGNLPTDNSDLETMLNLSKADTAENLTDTSNLTVVTFTDDALRDIIAGTLEEKVNNDTNTVSHDKTDSLVSDVLNKTVDDSLLTQVSNFTSISENISTSLEVNASDILIQSEPVDLPLPPLPLDVSLQNMSVVGAEGQNKTDTQTGLDLEVASELETNKNVTANETYIDEVNIYINDTGITIEHTPIKTIVPGSEEEPKTDLPPMPVDVPSLPPSKPSVDFIESSDSTTIEISDIFGALAGLGAGNVSTPMGSIAPETTTHQMQPTSPDSLSFVPAEETSVLNETETSTQPVFSEYATTTVKPDTVHSSYVHVPTKETAPTPDHPPPIFSGGSRPSVFTDPYGPHEGYFPEPQRRTTPKPVVTTEAPLPPIFVPTRSERRKSWSGQMYEKTTVSPYLKLPLQTTPRQIISGLDPRHMNVAELAAYALKMTSKKSRFNRTAEGIQTFFPTEPQPTTARTPFLRPTTTESRSRQEDKRSEAFVEYLRQKYGVNNVAPTTPYYTTTAKPTFIQKPLNRKFYDAGYLLSHLADSTTQKPTLKRFFDSSYLLSHLDITKSKPMIPPMFTTTKAPSTSKQFFDANYLISHLGELKGRQGHIKPNLNSKAMIPGSSQIKTQQTGQRRQNNFQNIQQTKPNDVGFKSGALTITDTERIQSENVLKEQRQGQVETRPISLKPNIQQQSFINYNVNPERNVRMNINLKPDINQWRENSQKNMFTKPPNTSDNVFAKLLTTVTRSSSSFKPVVYGTKPFNAAKQSAGQSLRERFNKKWYHPEDRVASIESSKMNAAVRNINIQIEDPSRINNAALTQGSRNGLVFSRNTGGINAAMHGNTVRNSLQNTNIDLQREILKQQELKLRQQQQMLKEQEAILLRQQQERQRQQAQKKQQQLLLQQQEQNRLLQLQQERQRQKEQELLLRQNENNRLLHQQHFPNKLQNELQRQQNINQQDFLLQQQERDRLLQQQLQRQSQIEQQRQMELEVSMQTGTQGNTHREQFPLASRTGQSEIRKNSNVDVQQEQHSFQPHVSSIQIFSAPAMLKKRKNTIVHRSDKPLPQTHWRAPSDLKHLHGHIPVPYNTEPIFVPKTTKAVTKPTTPATVFVATPAPTTVRRTTQPTLPTKPATADPNPPPIFDTKVRHTFMPMPKIDPTTKAPKQAEPGVTGWEGSQTGNTHFDERCQGCVFVNERCLLPDPVHCNFFIECVRQGSFVRAFSRECALGSFFDRKSFLCVDPKNADCPQDRCRIPGTKWYAIHGHCKHYWSCGAREGGGVFAQSECCPDMGGFVEPDGCVENPNCTDTCSSPVMMEGPPGCQLRKTASPRVYFDGNANIERPCAPGTLFSDKACTCVQDVTIERSESRPGGVANCSCSNETSCSCSGALQAAIRVNACMPILSIPFDGGLLQDVSNNKQHIGVDGISATMEGEAIFNGLGRLVIWRYANLMFPVVFALKFRFFSTSAAVRNQIIFSNCDTKGGQEPSVEISLDTLFHEVVFNVNTYKGPPKRFTIMYQQNKWSTVDFIYDGERIVGSVDKRTRNIFAGGGIETRPNPLGIGSCKGKDGFQGLLDDVFVYEECIPDEMYGIFMSVLE